VNAVEVIQHALLRSGSLWVLALLGLLSAASLAVAIERWRFFRSREADVRSLALRLDATLAAGAWREAIGLLAPMPASAAAIAAAGLRLADRGAPAVEKAMQSATALERGLLEQRLTYLGTVGNNAPFIGLFGTVVGIIHAFDELGSGAGAPGANHAASTAVMSSLAEALVATAVGILVALPAVAAFNYFQRRATALLGQAEVLANLVLAYVSDRTLRGPEGGPLPIEPRRANGRNRSERGIDAREGNN
jgi:biopolymer transport protein ExbB